MTKADINGPIRMDSSRYARAAFGLAAASLSLAALLAAVPAHAQQQNRAGYANEFSRPYGTNPGDQNRPYDAGTRDLNGNRVIIDGRIVVGDDLSSLPLGLYNAGSGGMGFSGTGTAIGNQLNVNTTGSFNTVIVNSTQINNGNQTVIINGHTTATNTGNANTSAGAGTGAGAPATPTTKKGQSVLNGGLDF
jgi:holdfast attachment protein HfaA